MEVAVESTYQWLTPFTKRMIYVLSLPQVVQSGRPDIPPNTPTHDVVTRNSVESTLFNYLLGSSTLATTAPSVRSVGEEVHEAASTEQDASTPKSFEGVTSVSSVDECIGGCDVISLSDIVPQTSSCY